MCLLRCARFPALGGTKRFSHGWKRPAPQPDWETILLSGHHEGALAASAGTRGRRSGAERLGSVNLYAPPALHGPRVCTPCRTAGHSAKALRKAGAGGAFGGDLKHLSPPQSGDLCCR